MTCFQEIWCSMIRKVKSIPSYWLPHFLLFIPEINILAVCLCCCFLCQGSYILLILSMGHTATVVMTLQIISTSTQDLIVTITCKFSLCQWNTPKQLIIVMLLISRTFGCFFRYPDKDAQYHFFRNYMQPDRPSEVCETKPTEISSYYSSSFLSKQSFLLVLLL